MLSSWKNRLQFSAKHEPGLGLPTEKSSITTVSHPSFHQTLHFTSFFFFFCSTCAEITSFSITTTTTKQTHLDPIHRSLSTSGSHRWTNLKTPSTSLRRFSYSTNGARSFRDWIELIGEAVSTAFPIWVALGCLLGLIKPSSFSWVQPKWTIVGITLTILGMGMTHTLDDLRGALAMPKQLPSGFLLEYSVSFMLSSICLSSQSGFCSRMLLGDFIPS